MAEQQGASMGPPESTGPPTRPIWKQLSGCLAQVKLTTEPQGNVWSRGKREAHLLSAGSRVSADSGVLTPVPKMCFLDLNFRGWSSMFPRAKQNSSCWFLSWHNSSSTTSRPDLYQGCRARGTHRGCPGTKFRLGLGHRESAARRAQPG